MHKLKIKIINPELTEAYENHDIHYEGDSGLDLFFPEDVTFSIGETLFVDLGIQCEMEKHDVKGIENVSYFLIPRSSISKTPLMMANSIGLIDAGYRGNIIMALKYVPTYSDLRSGSFEELHKNTYTVKKGTRLGQIILPTLEKFKIKFVEALTETTRGAGGFGSTDKKESNETDNIIDLTKKGLILG